MTKPHVIESMIVAIVIDPETGDEGVMGISTGQGWLPLVASDRARFENIRRLAQDVARERSLTVRMCQFTTREEIEVFAHGGPDANN